MSKKGDSPAEDELRDYVEMITKLDEFRAMRLWELKPIASIAKKTSSRDVKKAYRDVRGIIHKIIYYPAKDPEVMDMAKRSSILRAVALGCLSIMAFMSIVMAQRPEVTKRIFGSSMNLLIVNSAVGMLMLVFILMDYRLRKRLAKIYESKRFTAKKARVKATIQFLIDRLRQRIKRMELNPEDYKFKLYHRDYNHIIVVEKSGKRFTVMLDVEG